MGKRTNDWDTRLLIPVVLREDNTRADIRIPTDLTPAEAERLANIIKAFASPAPDTDRGEG